MIHQYKNNGYNIVLDVNSGSVHVVDALVYEAIELLLKQCPEYEIAQALKIRRVSRRMNSRGSCPERIRRANRASREKQIRRRRLSGG